MRSKAARANRSGGSENSYDVICDEINDLEANLPDVPKLPRLWTSDVTPKQLGNLLADHEERIAWLSSEGEFSICYQDATAEGSQIWI